MFSKSTLTRDEQICFGNFRNEENWSEKAQFFKLKDSDRERAKTAVENALVEDVYLCIQPYIVAMSLALNKTMVNSMRGEIQRILAEYGSRDILFVSKSANIPSFIARKTTELSPKIFLTTEPCSMPLSEFLLFYKGGLYAPPSVVEEWSGLTEDQQKMAYSEIVKFIRRQLEAYHKAHQQVAMSS